MVFLSHEIMTSSHVLFFTKIFIFTSIALFYSMLFNVSLSVDEIGIELTLVRNEECVLDS